MTGVRGPGGADRLGSRHGSFPVFRRVLRTAPAAILALLALSAPRGAGAQEARPADDADVRRLTLEEALARAREENTGLRVARARSDAARARTRRATSALLPQVGVESGWTRTADPVGVFGTKLRQGVFGPPDLAIGALNEPDPFTDWSTAATVRWSPAAPERWAARSAADRAAAATGWKQVRTRQATDLRTRTLYYRALGAGERVRAAEAALEAARATVERFRRRHEEGMLTRADLLQARAEREAAGADLARARERRHGARVELGLHLGWSPDSLPAPADSLTLPRPAEPDAFDASRRADVRARAAAVEAAEAASRRADLSWLPRLDAFGAWSMHGDAPLSDSGTDWTVGIGLRWDVFTGFRRPAEAREADAELRAARLEHRQSVIEARGEVRRARRSVEAARRAVEASRAARAAAREGRDLMRRRFEQGLATPADLLQAEARATAMEVRAVDALADYRVALARLRFARSEADAGRVRP